MNTIEKIKEKIDRNSIISFKIFDTLLLRNVAARSDIFRVVEKEYKIRYNKDIDFFTLRKKAEEEVIINKKSKYVSLDDIYNLIKLRIENEKLAEILKKIEIEIEKDFISLNSYTKELFEYAKSKNKRILLISDANLNENDVIEMLDYMGINGYSDIYIYHNIYKYERVKSIFCYIKNKENILDYYNWLHIGSNYNLDVVECAKYNIEGIKFCDEFEFAKTDNLTDSIIYAVKRNSIFSENNFDYWSRFGIEYVSPIYIGMMLNLIEWLKDKKNIYFLARDGYIPNKLYEILKKSNKDLPEGKYIYASRRAYIYPTLSENKKKAIEFLTIYNSSFNQNLTMKEIFSNIGLDVNNYTQVFEKFKFHNVDETISYNNIKKVRKILDFIWCDINNVLSNERIKLLKYLEQEKVLEKDRINIFDIGWAGSTHKALVDLTKKEVNAYYFGTIDSIDRHIKNYSTGYAFNEGNDADICNFIMYNVMMYELIFTSPEGSLKNFQYDKNASIKPNLVNKTNNINFEIIEKFQNGAIGVFEKVLAYQRYLEEPSKDFILSFMKKFIENKNLIDLIEFEKVTNVVSVGDSSDYKKYVTIIDSKDYMKNPVYYKEIAKMNLWRDAMIIKDNQGNLYSVKKFDEINNIKYNQIIIKAKNKINKAKRILLKLKIL